MFLQFLLADSFVLIAFFVLEFSAVPFIAIDGFCFSLAVKDGKLVGDPFPLPS